jgi:hypothetical protein
MWQHNFDDLALLYAFTHFFSTIAVCGLGDGYFCLWSGDRCAGYYSFTHLCVCLFFSLGYLLPGRCDAGAAVVSSGGGVCFDVLGVAVQSTRECGIEEV